MPGRHRPTRMPRRVRQLLRAALARARRRFSHQPRPTIEVVVEAAAQYYAQTERLSNSQRLLSTIQAIMNEPPLQETARRPLMDERPEESVAPENISLDTDDIVDLTDSPPDSPLPVFNLTNNLQAETCPVCYERPQQVLLNCQGRHALCGHCPARLYETSAKCPFCRDNFDRVDPLYNAPILSILPLQNRCTNLPDLEIFEITPPLIEISNRPDIDINMPPASPSSSEDWDSEYPVTIPPPTDHTEILSPLRHFSRPTDGQVQCLACSAWLINNPYRILRHTRRCPVLSQAYA